MDEVVVGGTGVDSRIDRVVLVELPLGAFKGGAKSTTPILSVSAGISYGAYGRHIAGEGQEYGTIGFHESPLLCSVSVGVACSSGGCSGECQSRGECPIIRKDDEAKFLRVPVDEVIAESRNVNHED